MELGQLRVFEAVVAHRTIAEAATALALEPSAVDAQLRSLERSLATTLLHRTPQGLAPTPSGERLLPWSRRLLEQAEQARREVAGSRPRLRLGVLHSIPDADLSAALAQLADYRLELHTSATYDTVLHDVAAGALDAALILDAPGPLGSLGFPLPPAPLAHLDLAELPLAVVAAPTHAPRLLLPTPGSPYRLAADLLPLTLERLPTGPLPTTLACTLQGLGLALLPASTAHPHLATATLTRLPHHPPPLHLRLIRRA
ncbi:LysR family transcriptional regulator [Kitasatospora sp. NPDC101183]|uniref:LysR family transcriptional regulator n=1 Tax=Kitasatospora sp. NPDC101183 TaxID=3364100 RepID=UPI0037FDFA6F